MKVQEYKKQTLPAFQNKLSQSELDLFKKMDIEKLLPYLKENSFLWANKFFFSSISIQALQELFSMIFTKLERKNKAKQQLIFHIINMMKQNTAIFEIISEQENFQKKKIFSFLQEDPISQDLLNVFADIFVIYARKIPGKLLKLVKDDKILALILNKMHLQPIHRIIFTMIFCLGHKPSINSKQVIQKLLDKMLALLFQCSFVDNHPSQSKILKNGQDKIDFAESMANMMNQIVVNTQGIYLGNIKLLLEIMDKNNFIRNLFKILQEPLQSQCSQYFFQILVKILELHTELRQIMKKIDNSNKIEEEKTFSNIFEHSERQVRKIIQFLPAFTKKMIDFERENKKITSSLGANIKPIGFLRYRVFELIKKIFEFAYTQECFSEEFSDFSLLTLIKCSLNNNKWNNITQNLIIKTFHLYLKRFYENFKQENLKRNISEGFLGYLIENFRNRHFIYLTSMRFSCQGDRHTIYLLSKEVIHRMNKNQDLKAINKEFPQWERFMHEDLKEYEKKCNNPIFFNEKQYELNSNKQKQTGQITDPLQTIEQIINELQDEKRWSSSPVSKKKARRRKQSLSTLAVTQQIDSLHYLQSQQSQDQE